MLNEQRQSTDRELAARRDVRAAIAERWPDAAARIRPSIIVDKGELPDDDAVRQAFRRLRSDHPIGRQWFFLAILARTLECDRLDTGLHRDDAVAVAVRPHLVADEGHPTRAPRLGPDAPAEYGVLAPFAFPLVDLTKVAMADRAREGGYLDILERSWFCHQPILGRPCGICPPCRTTRDEGLAHRTPAAVSARTGAAHLRHGYAATRHHVRKTARRLRRRSGPSSDGAKVG